MVITRWDPFRDIATLQNRMNTLFQDYSRSNSGESDPLSTAAFIPPVDIYENEHKVVLNLEVPGLKQEDLNIEVENSTLSIRGERKFEAESGAKEENFHRIERRYGSFYRAFTLPQTVNPESVSASYDAGILKVELEKRAESKPRQIKVQVGGGKTAAGAMPPAQQKQIENQPNA